jgi:hypothetical protein
MSDHEVSQYCMEKFRQYDQHLAESVPFRDKVNMIDASLGYLVKAVDAFRGSDFTIKMSLIGIVFAIVVQIGGFVYLWGKMTQHVDDIDKRVVTIEQLFPRAK